jgi:hypothetical protein
MKNEFLKQHNAKANDANDMYGSINSRTNARVQTSKS